MKDWFLCVVTIAVICFGIGVASAHTVAGTFLLFGAGLVGLSRWTRRAPLFKSIVESATQKP
jgi:hypothetical protein